MNDPRGFDPLSFLPYLLNQAADALSLEFQNIYKSRYGLLRTEWRVLFHLGCYGPMSAGDICARAHLHKTKVSRAVAALETKRFVTRQEVETDRRSAILSLTKLGISAFSDLSAEATAFDNRIRAKLAKGEADMLVKTLRQMSGLTAAD